MSRVIVISFLFILFGLSGCKNKLENLKDEELTSVFLNPKVGEEYTDSVALNSFLQSKNNLKKYNKEINDFYKKRDYKLAWSDKGKFLPQALSLVKMVKDVPSHGMMPISDPQLENEFNLIANEKRPAKKDARLKRKEMDILLTSMYFSYANEIWNGKIDLQESGWFIEKPKFKEDQVLEQILSLNITGSEGKSTINLNELSPLNSAYDNLQKVLDEYIAIQNNGGWSTINYNGKKALKKGDNSPHIVTLKKHLLITKDYSGDTVNSIFNEELKIALKKFQKRHGLKETGMMTKNTVDALNVPVDERINQLKVNMERWKWMPESMPDDYLWINIPEYKLSVYEDKNFVWDMNVIVGKHGLETSTPIFNDKIKYIVYNPTWRLPDNIVKKEVLPIVKQNNHYLMDNGIDVLLDKDTIDPMTLDWNSMTEESISQYVFIQKPVESNPLGKIKFMFPNDYDIYLHDTPFKYLFGNNKRSFSHGCIRIEDPEKLANYLLRNESDAASKIQEAKSSGKETIIDIDNKEPIFIVYFTTWIDDNGDVNFRDDIYEHDKTMETQFQTVSQDI